MYKSLLPISFKLVLMSVFVFPALSHSTSFGPLVTCNSFYYFVSFRKLLKTSGFGALLAEVSSAGTKEIQIDQTHMEGYRPFLVRHRRSFFSAIVGCATKAGTKCFRHTQGFVYGILHKIQLLVYEYCIQQKQETCSNCILQSTLRGRLRVTIPQLYGNLQLR